MTLFFLLLLPGSLGLQDFALIMPEAVESGKALTIRCLYNLNQEKLYQVKWYRGIQEFCRFTPKEVPPLQIFPIPGIDVNIRCAPTIYSAFYKSTEKSAKAEIIGTTIAPYTWTQRTSAYPKHHITQNSASWNSKYLWMVWLVMWEKLIELLQDIFYMKR